MSARTVPLHLRLSEDDHAAIQAIAGRADRPLAWMLARAVHEWLVHHAETTGAGDASWAEPAPQVDEGSFRELTVEPDPDHLAHENRPTAFDHQPMGLKTKGKKG